MSSTTTETRPAAAGQARGGKYLSFALGDEEYGLEILKVREIIRYVDVTPVPRVPEWVDGVINLRGQVIPVINLRCKFGLAAAERSNATCIIVVEVIRGGRKLNIGIVVDRVTEVLFISGEQIDDAPSFDPSVSVEFILGIGKVADHIKILLDIDRVLSTEDLSGLSHVHKQIAN